MDETYGVDGELPRAWMIVSRRPWITALVTAGLTAAPLNSSLTEFVTSCVVKSLTSIVITASGLMEPPVGVADVTKGCAG